MAADWEAQKNKIEDILEKMEYGVDFDEMQVENVTIILKDFDRNLVNVEDDNLRKELSEVVHETFGLLQNRPMANWGDGVIKNMEMLIDMINKKL
ncbi:hypothetical protein KKC88_06130 [Patescibacteria group bacterium]|nr:hypothetical protein [Patescibacteria group bacterium]MBU1673938.1 hypothetical protein [Patescibacteria group bacterium]MBU1963932.1 hypothetical protein [Patescibacteria group bacterium]